MEFEKAYQKFINGTATPEETEFVRSEMKKASDINEVLSSVKSEGATNASERSSVKRAMKAYLKKDTLKIVSIVLCAALVLAIGISCAIGIPILSAAKGNINYTEAQAKEIAIEYLTEQNPEWADDIEILRIVRDLDVEGRIKNARYVYVLDVHNGRNNVVEIEIDSKTGKILDVDR